MRRNRGGESSCMTTVGPWRRCAIRLKTDLDGNPPNFHLTGREVGDTPHFERSLDIGPDIRPRIVMTDKGYDGQVGIRTCRAAEHRTLRAAR